MLVALAHAVALEKDSAADGLKGSTAAASLADRLELAAQAVKQARWGRGRQEQQGQQHAAIDNHACLPVRPPTPPVPLPQVYSECPSYDLMLSAMLQGGIPALQQQCRFAPGVPIKPMLAKATRRAGGGGGQGGRRGETGVLEWRGAGGSSPKTMNGVSSPSLLPRREPASSSYP